MDMEKKNKWTPAGMSRLLAGLLATVIILSGLVLAGSGKVAAAPKEVSLIQLSAELLRVEDDSFVVLVRARNDGPDWEGTIRVRVSAGYSGATAYDMAIALPQGSEKQFESTIFYSTYSNSNELELQVIALDKKKKEVAKKDYPKFQLDKKNGLVMGILSDNYSALTYLDMGGRTLYWHENYYPITLEQLTYANFSTAETMDAKLAGMTMLLIDQYNTSVLTDEQIESLTKWVNSGGILIVGTGAEGENTLSGLTDNLLDGIRFGGITYASDNEVASNGEQGDVAIPSAKEGVLDLTQTNYCHIMGSMNTFSPLSAYSGAVKSEGDGAVVVVPFSFVELEKDAVNAIWYVSLEDFIQEFLYAVKDYASSSWMNVNGGKSFWRYTYTFERLLGCVGRLNNVVHFGLLELLVFLYVILIGPVLYLVLRVMKKREWYWVTVPAGAVIGVFLMAFAGRGFEVADTMAYSIHISNTGSAVPDQTILYCYNAQYDEWSLKLADDYEAVGPLMLDRYRGNEKDPYYMHFVNAGGICSFGIKPSGTFEDTYFRAYKSANQEKTKAFSHTISSDMFSVSGEVTNTSGMDFEYVAVIVNGHMYLYEDLPANGTLSLQDKCYYEVYSFEPDSMIYNVIGEVMDGDREGDAAELSALALGLCMAYPNEQLDRILICGVTKNQAKAVNDRCKEIAYGCYYIEE